MTFEGVNINLFQVVIVYSTDIYIQCIYFSIPCMERIELFSIFWNNLPSRAEKSETEIMIVQIVNNLLSFCLFIAYTCICTLYNDVEAKHVYFVDGKTTRR